MKEINILYYALLREERGVGNEKYQTGAITVEELYQELSDAYKFSLKTDALKVAVNNEFTKWKTPIKAGDTVIFIPPVAGG